MDAAHYIHELNSDNRELDRGTEGLWGPSASAINKTWLLRL